MHRGYVKLWRKIKDHEMMLHEGVCQMFLWIITNVRSEPGKFRGIDLEPGQIVVGRHQLSADLRQKPSTIYKRLKWLQSRNIVSLQSNNRHTIVTLLNWDTYNSSGTARKQRSSSEVAAREQRSSNEVAHKKNEKNKKKYLKEKNTKKEKSLLLQTFADFKAMRNKIRRPLTDRAEQLIFSKLQQLAPDNDTLKIAILEQSIENSYQGVFPLKTDRKHNNTTPTTAITPVAEWRPPVDER